jgi:DNA helicase-2/ATP-dependent DNA helicase PcrA
MVFVAGMEEMLFPHVNSIRDEAGIEEERRLAYVAITRARQRLYLTCANVRQIFGETNAYPQSRFISEIPQELRSTCGLGSSGLIGTGYEKRGSRKGIAGSGTETPEGRIFGFSGSSSYRDSGDSTPTNANAGIKQAAKIEFSAGDVVDHKTFGRGKVTQVDGDKITITFEKTQKTKTLMKSFAPIVKISL